MSGIVQGPVPPGPHGREQLTQFNDKLAKSGIDMSLRVDGANFSLLASDRAVVTEAVTESEIESLMESALGSLLEVYPEAMRMSVMSTIRSRVFLEGREHQAVYVVSFPGVVKVESAVIKAKLLPRARPLAFKHKVVFTLVALTVLSLSLWASARWIDYASIGRQLALMFQSNKLEDIKLRTTALGDVVVVEKSDLSSLRKVILLKVSRGPGWGRKLDQKNPGAVQLHAALIERRYLKATFFDVTGNVVIGRDGRVAERVIPTANLKDADRIDVEIPLPEGLPVSEIVIAP